MIKEMKKKINKLIDKSLRFHHRDIHGELNSMKIRAQVKSKWYYVFWGIATISVVAGQIYVGSGYHRMASKINLILDAVNGRIDVPKDRY